MRWGFAMLIIVGAACLGASVLGLRLCLAVFRAPRPPAWILRDLVAELITIGLVALIAVGLVLIAQEAVGGRVQPTLWGAALAVLVGAVAVARLIKVPARAPVPPAKPERPTPLAGIGKPANDQAKPPRKAA